MWTVSDLLEGCHGKRGEKTPLAGEVSGFSIDSRTIQPNAMFIALDGPRFDGHDFVEEALRKGGAGAIVSAAAFQEREKQWRPYFASHYFVRVEDPLKALQALAAWHRRRFRCPLIGITGSNGKTTTKEITAAILGQSGPVLKTKGNLNNHIGLPLTLLGLNKDHGAAVLEMGISQKGEMRRLCDIAAPTVGLITNIGSAHLEGLDDLEGVGREKGVLFESLGPGGTAVINRDDRFLNRWMQGLSRKWTFGLDPESDITAENIDAGREGVRFRLLRKRNGNAAEEIRLPMPGKHQIVNALGAAAVAASLGCGIQETAAGLAAFRPMPRRMEIFKTKGLTLLFDAYNANPDSVYAALQLLSSYPKASGARIAVLGEMLELGRFRESAHFQVGMQAAGFGIDRLFCLGASAERTADGARQGGMTPDVVSVHPDLESLAASLKKVLAKGDTLLLKGSRAIRMEHLLPDLGIGAKSNVL
ncbi:MAG: UDP-N-acetylmuramoyl-tripeptide--D-alanyl-D-alanine ligase [Nitrospiria bacterium]